MPDNIDKKQLKTLCLKLGLKTDEQNLLALRSYLGLLLKWNSKMNLIGAQTWQEAMSNLIADSFYLAEFINKLPLPNNPETWDLGAGAGLPGIPLRILWSTGYYHLVEVREKRALFLQTALAHLKLSSTYVYRGRAEEFMHTQISKKKPAHLIISRAFMPWQELTALVQPYLAQEASDKGILLLMLNGHDFVDLVPDWACIARQNYKSAGKDRQFVALSHL